MQMQARILVALSLCAAFGSGCDALQNDDAADAGTGTEALAPKLAPLEAVERYCLFMIAGDALPTDDTFFGAVPGNSDPSTCIHEVNRMQLPLGIGEVVENGDSLTGRFDLAHRLECAQSSSDLASFKRCITYEHGDYCEGKSINRYYCDGRYLIHCGGHSSAVYDCGVGGMGCWADEIMEEGFCVKEGETCPERPAEVLAQRLCRDNWVMDCPKAGDPMEAIGHCRAGETCKSYGVVHGSELAVCGAEPTCTKESCDGNTLVRCEEVRFGDDNPGFNPYPIDCTSIGKVCEVGFNDPDCVDTATECTYGYTDSCEGSSLKVCADGKVVSLPCSSIGLSTCDPSRLACK